MPSVHRRSSHLALILAILALGTLARLAPLGQERFHEDEALYSSWGLQIASGDVWLRAIPIDKPPLFFYLQAGAFALFGPSETTARLISLSASAVSIGLLYALARQIYDQSTALIAAALLAASPFAISFAPTAFLDAPMGMWVLAACTTAVSDRWRTTGILLGLASATKWEGIAFSPLVVGLGICSSHAHPAKPIRRRLSNLAGGLVLVLALVGGWDLARPQPSILQLLRTNYGGLALAQSGMWVERCRGWMKLLQYAFYHPWLNALSLGGIPLLLLLDVLLPRYTNRQHPAPKHYQPAIYAASPSRDALPSIPPLYTDSLLVVFSALFLMALTLLRIPIWARYLLALMPLGCLLLARILWLPRRLIAIGQKLSNRTGGPCPAYSLEAKGASLLPPLLVVVLLLWTLSPPLRDAAAGRFPIGGDHGAYQGIEQVVAYFRGHVMGGAILYHRWLGNHYRFYMHRFPYAFRWWQTPEELAQDAMAMANVERWIVIPAWRDTEPVRTALSAKGMRLTPRHHTYRADGSLSFTVYQIEGP